MIAKSIDCSRQNSALKFLRKRLSGRKRKTKKKLEHSFRHTHMDNIFCWVFSTKNKNIFFSPIIIRKLDKRIF